MGNMFGKNLLRKFQTNEAKNENSQKFRKNISERMASPLRENSLERIPGHDTIFFEK